MVDHAAPQRAVAGGGEPLGAGYGLQRLGVSPIQACPGLEPEATVVVINPNQLECSCRQGRRQRRSPVVVHSAAQINWRWREFQGCGFCLPPAANECCGAAFFVGSLLEPEHPIAKELWSSQHRSASERGCGGQGLLQRHVERIKQRSGLPKISTTSR